MHFRDARLWFFRECDIGAACVFRAILAFFILYSVGCSADDKEVDVSNERQALLAIYEASKRAHVNTNVEQLLANSGETFISVSNGKISRPTREDKEKFFKKYFENATYHEYDDLETPIVRVSSDGTLGWMITRLHARRTQVDKSGTSHEREFVYAGIMLYEKKDGKWIRIGNVSTLQK